MRIFIHTGKLLAASLLGAACLGGAMAQEATAPEPAAEMQPVTASLNNGWAQATLADARRDGDKLHLTVRFVASPDVKGTHVLYSVISANSWESDFYLLAGDKKYLLIKDASDIPVASSSLALRAGTPQAGSWSGTFPAPPAGESATLYLKDIEPMGPFTVP